MASPDRKPTHVKPAFYALNYEAMKEIAYHFGFNLVLHGSMNRDMDLIAIQWVDEAKPVDATIDALVSYLGGELLLYGAERRFSMLEAGRRSYVINLNRDGYSYRDPQWYLDISVTPLYNEKEIEKV